MLITVIFVNVFLIETLLLYYTYITFFCCGVQMVCQ